MMKQDGINNGFREVWVSNSSFVTTKWLIDITKKIWEDADRKKKLEDRKLKIEKLKELCQH